MVAGSTGWQEQSFSDGARIFRLTSWTEFFNFLEAEVFHASITSKHSYVWRGQRRDDWRLSSSLDRLFEKLNVLNQEPKKLDEKSLEHLASFRYAIRGRRGHNPAELKGENELWALGQHYGLATPLLDWTRSPFAAAYFAFEQDATEATANRIVWGLDQQAVSQRNKSIMEGLSLESGRPPVIEFFEPMSDENERLVNQGGLFTKAPIGMPIDQWIEQNFEGSENAVLLRIEIPNIDRLLCLQSLNRMNINHLSLFPDLAGASRFTNLKLELESRQQ